MMLWWTNLSMWQQCYTKLMMLQRCLCWSAACCDLHAVFCQSYCNAVSLELVSSFWHQCCWCPSVACCDLQAVLCRQLHCNAVGLESVSSCWQQYDAVMHHSLYVTAMLYNADAAAVSSACCELHAVLCQSPCNAVGLEFVSNFWQQYDAVTNHSSCVTVMLCNADDVAVPSVWCDLHAVTCMLCFASHLAMQWAWNLWAGFDSSLPRHRTTSWSVTIAQNRCPIEHYLFCAWQQDQLRAIHVRM